MALSNGAYSYFHITHYISVTFMFSHVCQWGEDYVFLFVLQKLLKKLSLV